MELERSTTIHSQVPDQFLYFIHKMLEVAVLAARQAQALTVFYGRF